MSKKIDFDKTIRKVEAVSSKIEIIMRNRLIIAFFLIIDGITFLLNPEGTLPGMARNIILLVLIAAFSILMANLASKTKDKRTIVISFVVVVLGIIFYIYPDIISAYMQLLLALFIIYDGAINIAKALNLDWLSKFTQAIAKKYEQTFNREAKSKKDKEKREKFKEVDDSINGELAQQKKRLISPLQKIVKKAKKTSILYIIANVVSIIFGLILLVFPDVSMMVWGIIFLYTGLPNLFAAIKSMELAKKIKEKKFKEILFDADKGKEEK